MKSAILISIFIGFGLSQAAQAAEQHDVTVFWQAKELLVKDTITPDPHYSQWYLSSRLVPKWIGSRPEKITAQSDQMTAYEFSPSATSITVQYNIPFDLLGIQSDPQSLSLLISSEQGLLPASGALMKIDVRTCLPDNMRSVSQGERTEVSHTRKRRCDSWRENQPQDSLYIVLGTFNEFEKKYADKTYYAFLLQNDAVLAKRYLSQTHNYVQMYEKLISAYPYKKFALVENVDQTGWGMPSFTLLGSQVIRMPFILHTSYPHEILHNWWGNSVFSDNEGGNWSEGLTSYLADHLLQEMKQQDAEHRRSVLQKYRDYVNTGNDFSLMDFRMREDSRTEAVGYGKSLMMFHMLRQQLGDVRFIDILQTFYRDRQFQRAGFSDLQTAFKAGSDASLGRFFSQWWNQTGAPDIALTEAHHTRLGRQYLFSFTLKQVQAGAEYDLSIPVYLQYKEGGVAERQVVRLTKREQTFKLVLREPVLQLSVDPEYDVFRRLKDDETPPSIAQLYAKEKAIFILPDKLPKQTTDKYQKMLSLWQAFYKDITVLDQLPKNIAADTAVWFLDQPPPREMRQWTYRSREDKTVILPLGIDVVDSKQSVVAVTSHKGMAIGWLRVHDVSAVAGLVRKLPHYGKYGVLVFSGADPENKIKQSWPVISHTLSWSESGDFYPWTFPQRKPLYKK